jgi:adenine-specific DNA-methyltransferase
MILNEIFGEENFVSQFIWRRRKTQANLSKNIAPVHDYILCYGKVLEKIKINKIPYSDKFISKTFSNPDNDKRGVYQTGPLARPESSSNPEWELKLPNGRKITARWSCSPETYKRYLTENRIVVPKGGEGMPRVKIFLSELEGQIPNTWLDNIATNDEASAEIEDLLGSITYFSYPKPSKLEKFLARLVTNGNDFILDFFAGSCSTAHAILELNKEDNGSRKFIMVQLPEPTDKKSEAYKAGYKSIAAVGKERIRRVIKKLEKEKKKGQDLGFKVFKLEHSNFKIWRGDEITEENLLKQLDLFTNPVKAKTLKKEERINMLYELMLKAGYELTDKIEDKGNYYSVNNGELVVALNELDKKTITEILKAKPQKVITLDNLFAGNDQLKTNTVLQMRDAEVEFKTV